VTPDTIAAPTTSSSTDELAYTGFDGWKLVGLAGLLLIIGAVLYLIVGRRRG
jgi:hypothetical protein